jgi:hypothetical protein
MYPQSLQTHSPCQYWESFSSLADLAAVDFLFPKTFNEVDVLDDDDTAGVIAGEKATVDPARNKQRTARKKDFSMVTKFRK